MGTSGEAAEYKAYGYRWVALAAFALIQGSIQILWSSFLPITGEAAEFYGVTPLMIGVLSMSFMFVYLMDSFRTASGGMTPLLLVLAALPVLSFTLVALIPEARMTASGSAT